MSTIALTFLLVMLIICCVMAVPVLVVFMFMIADAVKDAIRKTPMF